MIDIIMQRDENALNSLTSPIKLYIVYLSENEKSYAYKVAKTLRLKGISAELCVLSEPNIGKEIKYADKKKIEYVAIIGEKEAKEEKITVKNIKTRDEKFLTLSELISRL